MVLVLTIDSSAQEVGGNRRVGRRLRDGLHVESLERQERPRLGPSADDDRLANPHLEDALPRLLGVDGDLNALLLQGLLDTTRDLRRARLERASRFARLNHNRWENKVTLRRLCE